jgi:hypothetical protein
MTIFCKYKNILGEPNMGIHSFRFFNIAIVDVILTFILAFFIQKYLFDESYYIILFLTFLLGVFLHWIFCVDTTINSFLMRAS